jgi:hypothetical protein
MHFPYIFQILFLILLFKIENVLRKLITNKNNYWYIENKITKLIIQNKKLTQENNELREKIKFLIQTAK